MNTMTVDYDAVAEQREPIHLDMSLVPERRVYDERNRGHQWQSDAVVRGHFRHQGRPWSFTVHYGDPQQWIRVREGGDAVQLERAYLVPEVSVIEARQHSARRMSQQVRDGDVLEIRGRLFQIRDNVAFQNPQLYPVVDSRK